MRLSKVDKLANEYQDKIIAWRMGGDTVDQIRAKLQAEDLPPEAVPGRTGMSLFLRRLDRIKEYLLRYRLAAAKLGQKFDAVAEAKEASLNIELAHNVVMQRLSLLIEEGPEKIDVKEFCRLAQLVYQLTRARHSDVRTTIAVRKEVRVSSERAARAAAAGKTAPQAELTEEQILRLKMKLAGVRYEDWLASGAGPCAQGGDATVEVRSGEDGVLAEAPTSS